jgi:hypothetical protein
MQERLDCVTLPCGSGMTSKTIFRQYRKMEYNSKNAMLEFSSAEEAYKFHDQLTDALRMVMLSAGYDKTVSPEEDMKKTQEFFERYSLLAETLRHLREHLPRKSD